MGMAASQGRLLMMTARISNNEFEQQSVAYSKQRLTEESQQANDQYLEALQETQYQILTGYHGDSAQYESVTYNNLTDFNNVGNGKQYIVSDNRGKIVVTDKIKQAFEASKHDYNAFLATVESGTSYTQIADTDITEGMVHDAWDRYLVSIGKGHKDGMYADNGTEHILGFNYNFFTGTNPVTGEKKIDPASDYVTYDSAYIDVNNRVTGLDQRVYLAHDPDKGKYYVENYKLQVESYIDDNGETQYAAYIIASDGPLTLNNNIITEYPQEDIGKIYIDDVKAVPAKNSDGSLIYKKDGTPAYEFYTLDGTQRITDNAGNLTYDLYINKIRFIENNGVAFKRDADGKIIYDEPDWSNCFTGLGEFATFGAYTVHNEDKVLFYEGVTQEQRDLYDYAMALTRKYATQYGVHTRDEAGTSILLQHDNIKDFVYDADKVQYYTNIYNQMLEHGYTTYEEMVDSEYIPKTVFTDASGKSISPDSSYDWLVKNVKNGKLVISFYSKTQDDFIKTSLDDDESIVNKENKSKMAIAEQVYQSHMDRLEAEDKRFDMQLTKLESEHTALLTEYESVNKVISKNVEKSFGTFNA